MISIEKNTENNKENKTESIKPDLVFWERVIGCAVLEEFTPIDQADPESVEWTYFGQMERPSKVFYEMANMVEKTYLRVVEEIEGR
ncbi:MAG: hypothetical protein PHX30_00690 [Candidatus Pacebacteria bacterium]|nr:hypothetical protein [Candidatus Paceibacterota bacterium]